MSIDIGKVTVLGTGVLGSQIAFQCAYRGFDVTAYDISDDILANARSRFEALAETYKREVTGADDDTVAAAQGRLRLSSDLADAVGEADLVIEAIPEVLDIKRDTYTKLSRVAPEKTIFASNTSTLLLSDLKDFTGRPTKFLALHFAVDLWKNNIGEVMGTVDTDPAVFDKLVDFATAIGMVPIPIHKEKAGYVINSLMVPFQKAALELVAGGYASVEDVDKVWRIATGAPVGPLQICDSVGLTTAYNIASHGDERDRQIAAWLKENYIDAGKLGVATGEGFYRYTNDK